MDRQLVSGQTMDEERALYGICNADIVNCTFAGEADGESALKEAKDITVSESHFLLRYPLWHVKGFTLSNSEIADTSRAPIWYAKDGKIERCTVTGIKTLRECDRIEIVNSKIESDEFGWKCRDITLTDSSISSMYLFFSGENITLRNVNMKGKYSFQYIHDLTIEDSYLDTKDAFWHSENITVKNCTVKGEYLAWFSKGLTLINCKIIGTQPFCYCSDLKLIDCTMEDCDLAFEYSDVEATVIGRIDSVKNPKSGTIRANEVGEIIMEDAVMDCTGVVICD